jgi:hypothetical protein
MLKQLHASEDAVEQARASIEAGRIVEGQEILRTLFHTEPRHAAGRCLAGYAACLAGDYAAAETHSAIAVEAGPLLFDAHFVRAFTLSGLNRLDDACHAFRRVLALDPTCSLARLRMAEMLVQHGEPDVARGLLNEGRAHGITDEDVEAVMSLAGAGPGGQGFGSEPAGDKNEPDTTEVLRGSSIPAGLTWVDPRELLHPRRLDIAVKALYAQALLGRLSTHSGFDAEDAYLRHIQHRTGGAEPGDEVRKGDLGGFSRQFAQLVVSMREKGFDPMWPIPVARRTGIILNGAHRVAAALACGVRLVPVEYRDDVDGLTWDFDWFVENGFSPFELDRIARAWIDLAQGRAACVILWPPVEAHWDEIEREISSRLPIAAKRDYLFAPTAFGELIRDVYATDWGPIVGENIERKIALFGSYHPHVRFLVVRAPENAKDLLAACKAEMRERYRHVVPADRFATLHTTDTPLETAHVADIFLNPQNLDALRRRPEAGMRPGFMDWLAAYHEELRRLSIDPADCCVVGSAVLELFGVRQATDLDFTVTHAVREERFNPGVTHLTEDLDVVALDYPRAVGRPAPTDDDLIRDASFHVRFRGLKFAALDVVVLRKLTQRRPKDLADAALVGRMRLSAGN